MFYSATAFAVLWPCRNWKDVGHYRLEQGAIRPEVLQGEGVGIERIRLARNLGYSGESEKIRAIGVREEQRQVQDISMKDLPMPELQDHCAG